MAQKYRGGRTPHKTLDEKNEIYELYQSGEFNQTEIADALQCCQKSVSNYIRAVKAVREYNTPFKVLMRQLEK